MTAKNELQDILVEAEITMLPASTSGRTSGITSGYRPNHNFGGEDNTEMRFGEVTVNSNDWIHPGETKKVTIHFVMPEGFVVELKPGLIWRIQEGSNHVADGKILFVLESDTQ